MLHWNVCRFILFISSSNGYDHSCALHTIDALHNHNNAYCPCGYCAYCVGTAATARIKWCFINFKKSHQHNNINYDSFGEICTNQKRVEIARKEGREEEKCGSELWRRGWKDLMKAEGVAKREKRRVGRGEQCKSEGNVIIQCNHNVSVSMNRLCHFQFINMIDFSTVFDVFPHHSIDRSEDNEKRSIPFCDSREWLFWLALGFRWPECASVHENEKNHAQSCRQIYIRFTSSAGILNAQHSTKKNHCSAVSMLQSEEKQIINGQTTKISMQIFSLACNAYECQMIFYSISNRWVRNARSANGETYTKFSLWVIFQSTFQLKFEACHGKQPLVVSVCVRLPSERKQSKMSTVCRILIIIELISNNTT